MSCYLGDERYGRKTFTIQPCVSGRLASSMEPKEGERYFIYFDPKHPWTRLPLRELKFSPGWSLNLTEDMQITTNVGAFVERTFTGSSIRWVDRKFDDAG